MKYWSILIVTAGLIASCSIPKATITQTSSTQYRARIEKSPNQFFELVDVQLTDGTSWSSCSFRLLDDLAQHAILNPKGYGTFYVQIVTPSLAFTPNQALLSYRKEEDGTIKSMLVSLQTMPAAVEAGARPTLTE
jgi:hypothetical protein